METVETSEENQMDADGCNVTYRYDACFHMALYTCHDLLGLFRVEVFVFVLFCVLCSRHDR